jgi:Protein of unknown function (DUF2958)
MNRGLIKHVAMRMKQYPLYSQEHADDALVVVKLFNAYGAQTWFVTEYDPTQEIIFCYVTGLDFDEWGYTSLVELAEWMLPGSTIYGIELDTQFKPTRFSEIKHQNFW